MNKLPCFFKVYQVLFFDHAGLLWYFGYTDGVVKCMADVVSKLFWIHSLLILSYLAHIIYKPRLC